MNLPYRKIDSGPAECLLPRKNVLVNTVDECAVEVEQHTRRLRRGLAPGLSHVPVPPLPSVSCPCAWCVVPPCPVCRASVLSSRRAGSTRSGNLSTALGTTHRA